MNRMAQRKGSQMSPQSTFLCVFNLWSRRGPWTMNVTIHYGLPLYFLGTSSMYRLTFLYIIRTMTWIQSESPSSSFYINHFPKSELGDIDVWLWRQICRQTVHVHIKWTYNANHKHKKPKTHRYKMTFVVEILPLAI